MSARAQLLGLLASAGGLLLGSLAGPALAAAGPPVWINELHYDNAGADTGEGVELAGAAGTSLQGWTLVLYNGFDGRSYETVALGGALPEQTGHFGTRWVPVTGLQNGAPDGLALVDGAGSLVQLLAYEGTFTARDGAASGVAAAPIGPFEHPSSAVGTSLQLTGSGSGAADFQWSGPSLATPGQVNRGQRLTGTPAATAPPVAAAPSTTPPPGAGVPSPVLAPGATSWPGGLDAPVAPRSTAATPRLPILRLRVRMDPAGPPPSARLGAIRYVLTAPATVRFSVRRLHGTRPGPFVGVLTQQARAGRNVLRFAGRLHDRSLRAGRYRLTVSTHGVKRVVAFIVRRRSHAATRRTPA